MLIIPRNNMPSKKAEAEADGGGGAEASITLSFGGVDFCLCPDADSAFGPAASDGGALVSLVRQVAPGGPELALKNFSGTLRVAASCGGALQEPALATADAAKFAPAVEAAIGVSPELPPRIADLMNREEACTDLPGTYEAVAAFVAEHATPSPAPVAS